MSTEIGDLEIGRRPILSVGNTVFAGAQPAAREPPAQIANPASQNCIAQGGTLVIEERAWTPP